jgi:hypothetical protein
MGPAIQAGGSIIGGMMGSNAAGDAAKAMQESQAFNAQAALNNRVETEARMAPYLGIGNAANKRLAALLGLGGTPGGTGMLNEGDAVNNPVYKRYMQGAGVSAWDQVDPESRRKAYAEVQQTNALAGNDSNAADYGSLTKPFSANDLNADPVYQSGLQFGLDEGRRGLNERAIANGGYDSGATLKALTRFGNDYGSTKADQSFNRFQQQNSNVYNRLTGQQGVGLNAAGAVTGAGNLATGQMMDASSQGANAAAAGRVGQANAMLGAFGGIGTAIQGYQNNQIFNKLLNRNGGATPGGYNMSDVNSMFGY